MKKIIFKALFLFCSISFSQVYNFNSVSNGKSITHKIMLDENYFVETQYLTKTSEFILTRGGYYNKTETNIIKVNLEFNSNFFKDSIKLFEIEKKDSWTKSFGKPIDLNGKWLMAGRITEEGEKRRDISRSRKTMKFLKDGNFQWIAFNTETFQFFGSGGGTYSAKNGIYKENIQFFSRNNSSVGRILPFNYSLKGVDWHHSGKSSKGNPIYEIWTKRID
ncbi:MAG: hypothetical protein CBC28_03980 [Flavobacteriaceae bacterium TMED68]|nr:MAG: hypothetical protein CBC28_03980 [Flavobacteriaceae bacterium TMED68]